jgi:outer membrane protein
MIRKRVFQLPFCLVFCVFSVEVSVAQQDSLSLQELTTKALQKNPDIKSQVGQRRISKYRQWQSFSRMLPQADLEGNYIQTSGQAENPDFVGANGPKERIGWLSMRQTIFDAGILSDISLGKIDQKTEDVLFAQVKQDVLLQVIQEYFEALKQRDELKVLDENIKAFKMIYEQSQILYDNGVVPDLDVKKSQIEYLLRQNSLEQARKNYQAALNRVKELIAMPIGDSIALEDFAVENTNLDSLGSYLDLAVANRSELMAVNLEYRRAQVEKEAALLELLPSIGVGAYYGWDTNGSFRSANLGWQFYADLQFPLWHWGRLSLERRIAGVHLAQAGYSRGKIEAQIAQEVIDAYGDCQLQRHQMDVMQESKKAAADAVQMAQYGYKQGTVTNLDVINTQNLLNQSTIGYVQALYDFYAAKAKLYRNIGKLTEDLNWLE